MTQEITLTCYSLPAAPGVKNVTFCGQVTLPAIGQGTWYMGERADQRQREVSALRAGLDL
ncbi:hypothetical protein MJM83_32945, partial [Salmonella enterica subsp. enterica serovar Montevideo]|nr:hypothetical protein [Salmonella enterica subsp. enterica serovar Montevideo]